MLRGFWRWLIRKDVWACPPKALNDLEATYQELEPDAGDKPPKLPKPEQVAELLSAIDHRFTHRRVFDQRDKALVLMHYSSGTESGGAVRPEGEGY